MCSPARNPWSWSTKRIASTIVGVTAALGPPSVRFEAISTSGRPPPATNSPQALAGSTPLLDPPATLTHAEPAPAASAWAAPTGTFAVTWLVAGSTRETVLSFQFATHTAPSPNAT